MNLLRSDNLAFFRQMPCRLVEAWQFKLVIAAILVPLYYVPYFLLQRYPTRPVITLDLTAVDRAIPFDPRWVWVYLSLHTFESLTALLAMSSWHLLRYLAGMSLMAVIGFLFFFAFPVAGPRPPLPQDHGMYGLLVRVDTPLNSFPSLHVGIVVFTLLFGFRAFRPELRQGAGLFLSVLTLWGLLICYSTVATRQHYAVDVPAGALLAWVCHWLVWRKTDSLAGEPIATTPRLAEVPE